ncbi:MAG: oligosaccharide flippase family protein [Phycisphaerales bacterium]|nr:MAG: oligosaccharide flippase family protein [Phycisphaerales bacterium]
MNLPPKLTKLIAGTNLTAKCARGAVTLGIGTAGERALRFLRIVILTRFLAPDEFGIMALVVASLRALEVFTEVGVKQSVIQNKRGSDPEYLNVAWWMQVVRGSLLVLIAVLAVPWISSFYEKPELLGLLRVAFFAILFRGIVSPRLYVLEKEYKFGWAVLITQGSGVLGTVVTVVLAFLIRNVWALVIGFVAEAVILCVLSYIVVPFVPRFRIDRGCLRELMKFARGMFGLPILTWISLAADVMILGKLVDDVDLGMYTLAVQLSYLPAVLFAQIVGPVFLPGFAQKQDDRDSLRRAILGITRIVAYFVVPFTAFTALCASGLLLIAYGGQYTAVAIPCGILCLRILAQTEGTILATVYMAVGRPQLHRGFVAAKAILIVALVYPGIRLFGLAGAACAVVISNYGPLVMQVFWCRKIVDIRFGRYVRAYVPGLLLAAPMAGAVALVHLMHIGSPVVVLATGASTAAVTFTVVGIMVYPRLFHGAERGRVPAPGEVKNLDSASVRST